MNIRMTVCLKGLVLSACLSCCTLSQAVAVEEHSANLLAFERMGAGPPAGWKIDGDKYTWAVEPESGPLGIGAARIALSKDGHVLLTSPARAMPAGVNHTLTFWLRSEPAGAVVECRVRDNDDEGNSALKDSVTATAAWSQALVQGALPKAVKGRYYLELSVRGNDCVVRLDGLWLAGTTPKLSLGVPPARLGLGVPPARLGLGVPPARLGLGVAQATLEPQCAWGLVTGNAPLKVKARVVGATRPGCRLHLRAVNTLGTAADLLPIDLDASGVWQGGFEVTGDVARPFGMLRVEATVLGPDGKAISPMSETLLARAPEPVPGPLPESYFGVHVQLRDPDLEAVSKLGYKWIRIHDASAITKWGYIEPEQGKWIWHDDQVALARKYGLQIVGLLDTAPAWETGATDSGYFHVCHAPKSTELWRNYVKQVVGHYVDTINEWEVWNEPWDMGRFFQGGSPKRYVELLQAAYEEAKAANPRCTLLGVDTYPPFWEMAVLAYGAYPYYDVMTWHRYDPTLLGGPNDSVARVAARLQSIQAPRGKPKPILNSEGGPDVAIFHGSFFSFADPMLLGDWSEGADRYSRMFLSMIAAGNRRFIAYSVHSVNRHGQLTHNMVEPGPLLRPMHLALAGLAHFVDGAAYETRLVPAHDISAHVFHQPSGRTTIIALIADGADPEDLPKPLPEGIQCFDRWGNPTGIPKQATRAITYLVASPDRRAALLDALPAEPDTEKTRGSYPFSTSIDGLLDRALASLTQGAPPLWTLFSVQASLAVLGSGPDKIVASRGQLKADPSSPARFTLPSGTAIENRTIKRAGLFTVGSAELAASGQRWSVTFATVQDGPQGSWRFTSLTIIPVAGDPDASRVEGVEAVLKLWERALVEGSTKKLYDNLYPGPCCMTATTLNGEYFMFDKPYYLVAVMNTAVVWGPAAKSNMAISKVAVSGDIAALTAQWDIASLPFGIAPYAVTATMIEVDGSWRIAALSASPG